MRQLLVAISCWLYLASCASAQMMATGAGQGDAGGAASGGGCTQATTFLSGKSYTSPQQTSVTNFICSEVSNGNWAHLYMFAAAFGGSANDVYNWVQNTTMTFNGTITRNSPGWTSNGTTGYINTAVVPGLSFSASYNSVSFGGCIVNSRTSTIGGDLMGMQDNGAGSLSVLSPLNTSTNTQWMVTGSGVNSYAPANAEGFWAGERTGSAALALYLNGTSVQTATTTSVQTFTEPIYLLANNNIGTANNFTTDTMAYAFIGDGSVNIGNLNTDAHTLWTSAGVGGAGGC